ncbi:MAG: radical SAM protein [Dehalococcoidales bacterium]
MRVLLLSTPHPLEENPLPPLSLAYLTAVLEAEGVEVEVLDFLVSRYSPARLRRALADFRPQLVGVTCVTMTYPRAARMLRVVKAFDPAVVTVIGGPHVTFTAEETLRRAPWTDVVVLGEGEDTIVELAAAVDSGRDFAEVAGIAFRSGDTVTTTAPRPLISDLDRLPLPARHRLPLARYQALGMPCTVVTSRGCPYGCLFCSAHRMFGRRVRFRQPGLVVDEIERIRRDLGFRQINIADDTFTVDHRHAEQICDEILRRNLDLDWNAYARVDNMTPDLAALMKRAGCNTVLFGIESADETILKTIGKGITPDDMRRGVAIAAGAGLRVYCSFIIGLPGESRQTIAASDRFAGEINADFGAEYGYHILAPLPGTDLYHRAADYGLRITSRDWARYDANQAITEQATMSRALAEEALASYDEILAHAWEEIRCRAAAGDAASIERLEGNRRQAFVWALLEKGLIETAGRLSVAVARCPAEAEAVLAKRVARRLRLPEKAVRRELRTLVRAGLIELGHDEGGAGWRWRGERSGERHRPASLPSAPR